MPYYEEVFANRTHSASRQPSNVDGTQTSDPTLDTSVVLDSVKMLSYRSRPHPKAVGQSKIVEDIQADPYAGFLRRTSERQYREALESRGLMARGEPDRGHPFELVRHTIMGRPRTTHQENLYQHIKMTGEIPVFNVRSNHPAWSGVFTGGIQPDVIPYQESNPLSSFAQSAYSRVAPTPEIFNAGLFLGELLQGLPRLVPETMQRMISEARRVRPTRNAGGKLTKGAGSDYLNLQFGWLPLVSDIQNAAEALAKATVQLAQDGSRVHRRYELPEVRSSDLFHLPSSTAIASVHNQPGLLKGNALALQELRWTGSSWAGLPVNAGGTIHKARRSKRWFEGEFSSFYRLGFDPTSYLDRARELVKLELDPETLWNLAPWSWLVDWNLRLGDSIRANQLAANDRLVMHYGYAMETASYRSLHSGTHPDSLRSGSTRMWGYGTSFDTSITTTYKKRIRANPYGFRINTPSAFTGGQLAILGALGLTKF